MKIHTAIVQHRHGSDCYLGGSDKDVKEKVCGFISEWWKDEVGDEPMPDQQDEKINRYFECVYGESVTFAIDDVDMSEAMKPAVEKIMKIFWKRASSYLMAIKRPNQDEVDLVGRQFRKEVELALAADT